MSGRIALLMVVLVTLAWPAVAGAPPLRNTYVLTQAYCNPPQSPAPGKCHAQSLPVGALLEIQVPGTPSVWTVASTAPTLEAAGSTKLPSPGRIAGTSEVYVFTFKAVQAGSGDIVLQEAPPMMSKPGGKWTFPITVK